VEKTKSDVGLFAVKYKSETYDRTQKLNKEDYGFDKYWVLITIFNQLTFVCDTRPGSQITAPNPTSRFVLK
jgi:alkyl hydroperoxide reductase subunit AhpC